MIQQNEIHHLKCRTEKMDISSLASLYLCEDVRLWDDAGKT